MIEKIKELRTMLPIPISEAKQLLLENDSDIETCVLLYTAKALRLIMEATGTDKDTAGKHYRKENFDINRAIFTINDEIYDANYQPIKGVGKESLQVIKDWIYLMEKNDFASSLTYPLLHKAIDTLQLIPELKDLGNLLGRVKEAYDLIFEGYNDDLPMDDFIRRNRLLDDNIDFQKAYSLLGSQILNLKNEIDKHWRNV